MRLSPLVEQLIEALRGLPGVGPKSAQRMAFYLLSQDRQAGVGLGAVLQRAMSQVGHCEKCRTFCEIPLCQICDTPSRDQNVLCVVESPADMLALEHAGNFDGLYFVLSGRLSPIDGIGPEDIGMDRLEHRLDHEVITEVVLATNATVEGEATAYYISELVKKRGIQVSRIAQGVPLGGELEYVDSGTLARALSERSLIE